MYDNSSKFDVMLTVLAVVDWSNFLHRKDGGGVASEFDELLEIACRLGVTVRHVKLGGNGGGIARFKNQRQLFIDQDAGPMDQLEQTAKALAGLEELGTVFIRPDVRKILEQWGGAKIGD